MEAEANTGVTARRPLLIGVGLTSVVSIVIAIAVWSNGDEPLSPQADAALIGTATDLAGTTTTTAAAAPFAASATTQPERSAVSTTTATTTSTSSTTTAPPPPTSSTTTTIDPDRLPTLTEWDTGPEVLLMQRMLNIVTGSDLAVDGVYGPATTAAVDALQRILGLPATGEADHETRMILRYMDAGRSGVVPSWPLPTIGDGGADGCQVAVVGDSLMAGAQQLHADRLAEIGCASAVDGVGGRAMAFGWQCRVLQPDGRRRLRLLPEPEPGNATCAPSGLELLRMWSDARALGDVLVLALGTNDATLIDERNWRGRWEQVLAFTGTRPVVVVTTHARSTSQAAAAQATYSDALRQWCGTQPRCVLADWALTAVANDSGSYVDSVHLTFAATDARATFIRDVVGALVSGRPIPNPAPVPTPTSTLPPAPPSTSTTVPTVTTTTSSSTTTTSTTPTTTPTTTSTTVPASTTTLPTTTGPSTSTPPTSAPAPSD